MIRINLMPQARKAARTAVPGPGSAQGWAVAYIAAVVVWGVVLAAIYVATSGRLDEQRRQNAALQARIDELRERSAQLDEVRAKIAASKQLEAVVQELHRARLGPTRVLMELSRVLSVGGGPTIDPERLERIRRENPLVSINRSWDGRRLWLRSFVETDRECRITGVGRTHDDVGEFLQRLALSEVFESVSLTKTEAIVDEETRLPLTAFELTCRVRY
ncbi:MAG: PilN domain-containing protein [Myxococcota bacterium]|nr:PilN domain-containing protein [Myxococcota bacterium]MDW8362908.1 PilN domain-containing protein [Myxococcales bacterium]